MPIELTNISYSAASNARNDAGYGSKSLLPSLHRYTKVVRYQNKFFLSLPTNKIFMTSSLAPLLKLNAKSFRNTILEPRTMTLAITYSENSTFKAVKIKLDSVLSEHLMTLRKYKSGAGYEILTYQIQELVEQERVAVFKRKLKLLVTK